MQPSYFENVSYNNTYEYVYGNIQRNLNVPGALGHVLDFGCGSGDASRVFLEFGADVTAIDISAKSLAAAAIKTAKFDKITLIKGDLNKFSPSSESFDVIWADTVLELLETPIEKIIENFAVALKAEGVLYVSLTERNLTNLILYKLLFFVALLPRQPIKMLLKKVLRIRYRLRGVKISDTNLENKMAYLFVPFLRLLSREQVKRAFEDAGFEVLYVRDRVQSDPNSPSHFEIKGQLKTTRMSLNENQ